ncbi:glycosyltransferase family 2 protein [Acinetobacter venetianus]|uniref:glycosyltransferase family 2 protein n=1 Tax=Acinetobacter venetianus TaxID=52133 RepID=UPI003A90AF5E
MKVSIITATFNSENTVIDTLHSLNQQTYPDIEYIIIDGGSSDNTVSVINQNCPRVSKIISEPDKGIYDALNKGIGIATGDVVGFLHSDDLFAYPEAVQDLVDAMNNGDAQAVYADLEYVSKNDTSKVIRKWVSGPFKREYLRFGWMPPHPTFFMRREIYNRCGMFDLGMKISADYDSLLRYLWGSQINVTYLPKVVTKMRVGGASNRSLKNIIEKTKEDVKALKNNNISWPVALFMKNFSKIPQFFKR